VARVLRAALIVDGLPPDLRTGAWPGIQTFGGWKNSGVTGRNGFGSHYLPQFMREQSHTL
jgi:1-pyrroline-5-carboxylate dehydrogenase